MIKNIKSGLVIVFQKRYVKVVDEVFNGHGLFGGKYKHGEKDQVDSLLAEEKRGAICVGVYVGDVLVAIASTTADTALSSMLVGVCTHPDYPEKGYASLAVSTLLKNRFEKSEKFVCLFYDYALAGRIDHALGFEDVASYAILN